MSTITIKTDKPMVLIPLEEYEGLKETIELLSINPNLADDLKKIREEMDQGHYITLEDFKKKHKGL